MSGLVRSYRYLFRLPSLKVLMSLIFSISLLLSFITSADLSMFLAGLGSFLSTSLASIFLLKSFVKAEWFTFKRASALITFNLLLWGLLYVIIISLSSFMGLRDLTILRLILYSCSASAFFSCLMLASSLNWRVKAFLGSLLQPTIGLPSIPLAFYLIYGQRVLQGIFEGPFTLKLTLAYVIFPLAAYLFVWVVKRGGKRVFGEEGRGILEAFISFWLADDNEGLERVFKDIGEEVEASSTILAFKDRERLRGVLTIPGVHPGPFKDVGGGNLPADIVFNLEGRHGGIAMVAHGVSGHELDLASSADKEKFIEALSREVGRLRRYGSKASFFKRAVKNHVNVCCQIFEESALFIVTIAPLSMEDLPMEVKEVIGSVADEVGVRSWAVIDAHNCINEGEAGEVNIASLKEAARQALSEALETRVDGFKAGFSRITLKGFSRADGVGDAGLAAMVIEASSHKAAYIFIDGNNMVSSLRDKILNLAKGLGFEDCEVVTSDTHSVTALTLGGRGYHAVGEAFSHEVFIDYVKEAIMKASDSLSEVSVAVKDVKIPGIRVIGSQALGKLKIFVEETVSLIRKLLPTTIAFTLVITTLIYFI